MNAPGPADPTEPAPEISAEAARWLARLDRGLSPDEQARLAVWQASDPRHAAALDRLLKLWRTLDTADEVPEIMRLSVPAAPARARRLRRERWFAPAAAAALALATLGAWIVPWRESTPPARGPAYRIVPSDAQRLTLGDGTVVQLKEGSTLEPAFSTHERRVRLVRGEAFFEVAHDAARPFVVLIGDVAVQAVGTAFNIRLADGKMEVLVTQGRVRVDDRARGTSLLAATPPPAPAVAPAAGDPVPTPAAPPVLTAGDRVVIDPARPQAAVRETLTPRELDRALSWQGTELVFDDTPLAEAVAAFNSFNRLQLVIADPALERRRLGGSFRADNVHAFVRLLETGFEIAAERRGENEIALRRARP